MLNQFKDVFFDGKNEDPEISEKPKRPNARAKKVVEFSQSSQASGVKRGAGRSKKAVQEDEKDEVKPAVVKKRKVEELSSS